jgi:MFS family permease
MDFPETALAPAVAPAVAAEPAPSPRRWGISAVLMGAVIFGFFDRISVAVLFTWIPFQDAMGTGFNPTKLGLLMTVFLIAYALSAVFLSFTGDVFGQRRSLAVSSSIWGLAMASMGLVTSFPLMLVGRAVLGLAEGPQFSYANALVGRWFPRREQARASSMWLVGSPLGSTIGFPLVAFLVTMYGWRAAFIILGVVNVLVVVPLILGVVREFPPGMAQVKEHNPTFAEYRKVGGEMMRDWRIYLLMLYNVGSLIYIWGLNSWLPTYMVKALGFNLAHAGLLSSIPFIGLFAGEVSGAVLGDKLGRHAIISGIGLTSAAVLMYAATRMPDAGGAIACMGLSAFSLGCAIPTYFACSLRVLPKGALALGSGLLNGVGNLVGAGAPVLIGFLITTTGSFQAGLMVLVGAPLIGAVGLFVMAVLKVGE